MVSILTLFALILLGWMLQSLFPETKNNLLKSIVVSISSIVGVTFLFSGVSKRKSMEKMIRECRVEEMVLTIRRFARKSVSNTELTSYLCDCPEERTVFFQTERYLQNGLNTEIEISVVKLVDSGNSILLSIKNSPSMEKAEKIMNVKFPEELLEHEFKLLDSPFESFMTSK